MKPKISIVTPSFNQGQFLEETIDSVLSQNYSNLEYIIIDGGSTDNSVEVIKKYAKFIHYWVSEADNGQSHAINKGLALCTGQIFNWLNSDDCYESDVFKKVSYLFNSASTHIVAGRERIVDVNGDEIRLVEGSSILNTVSQTIYKAHIDQPPTFWKLDIIKKIGGLSNAYDYLMDAELWIKYLLRYGQDHIVKTQDIYTKFRLHETSKTVCFKDKFVSERINLNLSIMNAIGYPESIIVNLKDYLQCNVALLSECNLIKVEKHNLYIKYWNDVFLFFYFGKNRKVSLDLIIDYVKHGGQINIGILKAFAYLCLFPDQLYENRIKKKNLMPIKIHE